MAQAVGLPCDHKHTTLKICELYRVLFPGENVVHERTVVNQIFIFHFTYITHIHTHTHMISI